MSITLQLERAQFDIIIAALAQRPYAEVVETISLIARQVQQAPGVASGETGSAMLQQAPKRRGRKPRITGATLGNGAAQATP